MISSYFFHQHSVVYSNHTLDMLGETYSVELGNPSTKCFVHATPRHVETCQIIFDYNWKDVWTSHLKNMLLEMDHLPRQAGVKIKNLGNKCLSSGKHENLQYSKSPNKQPHEPDYSNHVFTRIIPHQFGRFRKIKLIETTTQKSWLIC